ncbi:hypothetical protein ACJ73_03993 [Blastomyces percursus]|uniref:Uncharacterized protein n=1 Tax=Blastomyces percursus TaxID=1658174 RepID=A0A1J9Q7B3_9EURO|nr:hypothetical protein ACJ73_03993 [Blastomyces percursus]
MTLFRDLVKGNEQPIPRSLIELLKECYPSDFTLEIRGSHSEVEVSRHDSQLWETMSKAFDDAVQAQRYTSNESAWSNVARILLRAVMDDKIPRNARPCMFAVREVSS